jgi:hypothetical protein
MERRSGPLAQEDSDHSAQTLVLERGAIRAMRPGRLAMLHELDVLDCRGQKASERQELRKQQLFGIHAAFFRRLHSADSRTKVMA